MSWKQASTTNPVKDPSGVEVLHSAPGSVLVLAPGVIASMTTDWGAHWRTVGLPQIYQSYTGVNGMGGWPFCCV